MSVTPNLPLVAKYQLALEVSPVPMLVADGTGQIIIANPAMHALFEYDGQELIGDSVEILVPEAMRGHHHELRDAYAKAPVKRQMGAGRDLFGVTKSGQSIPLELGLEPVESGVGFWVLLVAIDIRERQSQELRMRQALNAAASSMVMVDRKGKIVFANQAGLHLFGYEADELLGQPVELLVPADSKRAHPVFVNSFMNDKSTRSMGLGRDLFARHKDGTHIPVEITLTPVEADGEALVMSTIIDLTERRAAKAALEEKNQDLLALNAELAQFAYSASHDLKAPLVTLMGLLDWCIEDLKNGETNAALESLNHALGVSKRSANKIEAVLDIARVGRSRLPNEAVHIQSVLETCWADLANDNEMHLHLDLNHEEPVITERAALGVIVENFLSNALRFRDGTKDKPAATVRTWDDGVDFHMSVSDNGIGISDENQARVFEMFSRLDERSGTGLGLALVKKQIDRLGGTLALQSREGEGTEFSFSLKRGKINDEDTGGDRRR